MNAHYPKCPYVFFDEGRGIMDFRAAWDSALLKVRYKPSFNARNAARSQNCRKTLRGKIFPVRNAGVMISKNMISFFTISVGRESGA